MKTLCLLSFFLSIPVWCGSTRVLFEPASISVGPFPANALSVPNPLQKTGIQVNLPLPEGCTAGSSANQCVNIQLLNELDGFSLNPRLMVCFSGQIDPSTLRDGVHIVPLDSHRPIEINQIVFDPASMCAYAKPDQVLDQQTQYVLLVTSEVLDADGKRVKADNKFGDCVKHTPSGYCKSLSQAIGGLGEKAGNGSGDVVAASLFTTLSATTWLERARQQVVLAGMNNSGGLMAPLSTFEMKGVKSIVWKPQTGMDGVNYDTSLPLEALTGVDRISFGVYLSPLYLNTSGPEAGTIKTVPTNLPPVPTGVVPVSFHVFLPAANTTSTKIPLIIYGHGLGDNQFGAPTFAASTWAQRGFATLAIEISGHGFGPLSTTEIETNTGHVSIPTPGRGIQFAPNSPIGPTDGCILPNAIGTRDCGRQTAVDLFGLVTAIKRSGGLGLNLDTSRIYYVGQSFGALYGTLFEAVDPDVSSGVLNGGGGSQIDVARLGPIARQLGTAYLAGFAPPLLNVPPASPEPYFHDRFNDEYAYRGPAMTSTVSGAPAIQAAFEQADWLGMLGDPLSYAGHLKQNPLSGVPEKRMLVQFALGDLEMPNPTESALVRAGELQRTTWLLRTDWAAAADPRLLSVMQPGVPYPIYPHRFLSNPMIFDPGMPPLGTAIAIAAQKQAAEFLTSGTAADPNQYLTGPFGGSILFQHPADLPDRLNFFQLQP